MDIRELRSFTYVATLGSFSRAAAQLNIAQPALSRQLKKLEEELGVQLLIRNPRGVELTEAGTVLLAQAEILLLHLKETVELVSGHKEKARGRIVVGLPPTCGLVIGPKIFDRFRARWPHVTLSLREGISSSLEEWLLDRRIDLAVMHNPLPLEGIDIEPVLHERMVLVRAPSDSPKAKKPKSVRIRDLANIPLILPSLPHSNRRLIERIASQHGARLNVVAEIDSVRFTKALVKQNFGQTLQTYAGVVSDLATGELDLVEIDHPPMISTLCIGMPRETRSVWLNKQIAHLTRTVIAEAVANGDWAGARMIGEDEPT